MRHALVLAGGSGTRLWPFSRRGVPKQLAPLFGDRSLLDLAVERATAAVDAERVWLAAGEQLREQVTQVAPERLVLEPSGRDTLPALVLAVSAIADTDPEAVVAVVTLPVTMPLAPGQPALTNCMAPPRLCCTR